MRNKGLLRTVFGSWRDGSRRGQCNLSKDAIAWLLIGALVILNAPEIRNFFLVLSARATATHYFAPTAVGSGNGSNCSNAAAEATYTTGSWGGIASPGDTFYACPGTYTATFFWGGNGTSGAPITLQCDPAALFSVAVWSGSYGAISTTGGGFSSWVVNGCTVRNTANGTNLANQASSKGIYMVCNAFPCLVENSTVSNIYVNVPPNDIAGAATIGIEIVQASTATSGCAEFKNNTINDVEQGIVGYAMPGTTTGCFLEHGDMISDSGNSVQFFTDSSTIASITHYGSTYSNGGNWDTTGDTFHMEPIHDFTDTGSTISLVTAYNLTILGSWDAGLSTSHYQGGVYVENVSGAGTITSGQFFNIVASTSTPPDGAQIECFSCANTLIVQNTLSGAGNTQVQTSGNQGISNRTSPGVIIENNIIENFYNSLVSDVGGGSFATDNFNLFYNVANWTYHGTFYFTLPSWVTGTAFDANSLVANPQLNGNYTLQSTSPARGLGANLTSSCIGSLVPLCRDAAGVPRSASLAWDAGAFSYASAVNPASAPPAFMFTELQPPSQQTIHRSASQVF